MLTLEQLTNTQLMRLYYNMCGRIHNRFRGDMFGVDEQTLRVISPSWYNTYKIIDNERMRRLNDILLKKQLLSP